jgi:hypothetical protein
MEKAAMAKNPVQFQKGLSLHEFFDQYGNEEQCHSALYRLRWPQVSSAIIIAPGYSAITDSCRQAFSTVESMQCTSGTTAMFVFLSAPTEARRIASHLWLSCSSLGMGRSQSFPGAFSIR